MYIANIDDFDTVWKLFHENKKWFPHVRKFHIRNRLKWKQVMMFLLRTKYIKELVR